MDITFKTMIGKLLVQGISADPRNVDTLIDAVFALIFSQNVYLSAWVLHISKKIQAGSILRRFERWLDNPSIVPHTWYAPLFHHALREWTQMPIFLVLDTSMLFDRFCCVRISMLYMNRAIPVTWCVLEHNSSTVKFERYVHLFAHVEALLPQDVAIVFLADRGFVCKKLMCHLQQLKWNWRIRVKSNQKLRSKSGGFITPKMLPLSCGKALLFSLNINFGKGLERVSLSAGWGKSCQEPWYVLSGDAASTEVFMDYGRRFGIEEGFRDEKSGGFDLEASRIRDAQKLERLLLIVSIALLVTVSEGTSVMLAGERKEVDPHHRRSLSCFQIGLRWIVKCLLHGVKKFLGNCLLKPMSEPLPVASTRKESCKRRKKKNPAYLFMEVQHSSL